MYKKSKSLYKPWTLIMMCQVSFISCSKCTTLAGDPDNGGDYVYVEAGDIWKISVFFTQFYCDPKTVLKK